MRSTSIHPLLPRCQSIGVLACLLLIIGPLALLVVVVDGSQGPPPPGPIPPQQPQFQPKLDEGTILPTPTHQHPNPYYPPTPKYAVPGLNNIFNNGHNHQHQHAHHQHQHHYGHGHGPSQPKPGAIPPIYEQESKKLDENLEQTIVPETPVSEDLNKIVENPEQTIVSKTQVYEDSSKLNENVEHTVVPEVPVFENSINLDENHDPANVLEVRVAEVSKEIDEEQEHIAISEAPESENSTKLDDEQQQATVPEVPLSQNATQLDEDSHLTIAADSSKLNETEEETIVPDPEVLVAEDSNVLDEELENTVVPEAPEPENSKGLEEDVEQTIDPEVFEDSKESHEEQATLPEAPGAENSTKLHGDREQTIFQESQADEDSKESDEEQEQTTVPEAPAQLLENSTELRGDLEQTVVQESPAAEFAKELNENAQYTVVAGVSALEDSKELHENAEQTIVPEASLSQDSKKLDGHLEEAIVPEAPISEVSKELDQNIVQTLYPETQVSEDSNFVENPEQTLHPESQVSENLNLDENQEQIIVPETQVSENLNLDENPEQTIVRETKVSEDSDSHGHDHHHHNHDHHSHEHHHEDLKNQPSYIVVIKHLSATLVSFLPEYLQDMIFDVNDALVFTGIIALTLISVCVPYFFIAAFLSARPLKKRVTELNKTLWKVSTAYENQQEEYEAYKAKALAYDEDQKRIEKLEIELDLVKKLESKQKDQIRLLQKKLKSGCQVASEVESLVESTMDERNKAVDECNKLKTVVASLQSTLKHTSEELETAQSELENLRMDLKLADHTKENLESKVEANNREVAELRKKLLAEVDLRRKAQADYEVLLKDKASVEEQLQEANVLCHKYEESVNSLNDEIFQKENELLALKETLGEDSPLVEISEITARLKGAEGQATSLQSRVESLTLENSSLTRDLTRTKQTLEKLQTEKDSAETRLSVLESYFNEKDEQHRVLVEKYEQERNLRGKDKEELAQMIEDKNDEIRDLNNRLEQLKEEFEQTKLTHKSEIRKMENKIHQDWLSICQSERKAQESKKEADLLRQKLTSVTKAKENDAIDGLSQAGDRVPYSPYLDFDDVPPPLDIDEPPPPLSMPSYFGLPVDFEPPCPLEDDDGEENMDSLHGNRPGAEGEPLRPPPLGRLSPTNSDVIDDIVSPIVAPGGRGLYADGHGHGHPGPRDEYSDGSSSPQNNNNNWSSRNGTHSSLSNRGGPPGRDANSGPLRTSSPVPNYNQTQFQPHGINL